MALIKPGDSLAVVFDDTLYTAVKLYADPATKSLSAKIEKERDALEDKAKARLKASEAVVRMEALADYAYEEAGRKLVLFEKAVDHVHAEDPVAYAAYFPLTPSQMVKAPIVRRAQVFAPLVKKCKATAAGKAPLAADAKAWLALWQGYVGAAAAQEKAEEDEAAADKAVQQQKVRCCVAMREAHGRLEASFPDSRTRVESFFRKRKKAAKKSAAAAAAAAAQ